MKKSVQLILILLAFSFPIQTLSEIKYQTRFYYKGNVFDYILYEDRYGHTIPGNDNSFSIQWYNEDAAIDVYLQANNVVKFTTNLAKQLGVEVTNSEISMRLELAAHAIAYIYGERKHSNPADIELNYRSNIFRKKMEEKIVPSLTPESTE